MKGQNHYAKLLEWRAKITAQDTGYERSISQYSTLVMKGQHYNAIHNEYTCYKSPKSHCNRQRSLYIAAVPEAL